MGRRLIASFDFVVSADVHAGPAAPMVTQAPAPPHQQFAYTYHPPDPFQHLKGKDALKKDADAMLSWPTAGKYNPL